MVGRPRRDLADQAGRRARDAQLHGPGAAAWARDRCTQRSVRVLYRAVAGADARAPLRPQLAEVARARSHWPTRKAAAQGGAGASRASTASWLGVATGRALAGHA